MYSLKTIDNVKTAQVVALINTYKKNEKKQMYAKKYN